MTQDFKCVFVGDQHNSDQPPKTRLDDYKTSILTKLQFILDYTATKQIPHIFFMGDMFHRKRPHHNSYELTDTLMKMYLAWKKSTDGRIFAIWGNHDYLFTLDNSHKQPLKILETSGALEIIQNRPVSFPDHNIEVNGLGYCEQAESDPAVYNLLTADPNAYKIWLFHSTLLPDGEQFYGTWVNFHQIKDIAANLVVCGHFHPGYTPTVIQAHDKLWANPGSISRGTAEDHNLTRQLKVLAFVHRADGTTAWKDVPIPHAPAIKVFDLKALQKTREQRSDMEDFVAAMDKSIALEIEHSSVHSLKTALAQLSTDLDAVAAASQYIEDAADELGI